MDCPYCRYPNEQDDRRCQRCGRRLESSAMPPRLGASYSRLANARDPYAVPPPPLEPEDTDAGPNVVSLPPRNAGRSVPASGRSAAAPAPAPIPDEPVHLPKVFLRADPPTPAGPPGTEDTELYCKMRVAGALHRAMAATLDAIVVAMAVVLFGALFVFWVEPEEIQIAHAIAFALTFVISSLFYRLMFAMVGVETIGMQWTNLRLVNFQGDHPSSSQHMIRVAGTIASLLPLGLGLIWALFDEDRLGWHDYISGTFPTVDEEPSAS